MIIKCGQDISIDQCHPPNNEKKKKKKEKNLGAWYLIIYHHQRVGKKHKMACAFSEKKGKLNPSFSSLWKIENAWGRPIEEFASQKLRGSTLLTWLHHCSVLLLMSWLNAYFSISASLSSCLNFCIIWNFGRLTITFISMLSTFSNIHFNKFFIIFHFI